MYFFLENISYGILSKVEKINMPRNQKYWKKAWNRVELIMWRVIKESLLKGAQMPLRGARCMPKTPTENEMIYCKIPNKSSEYAILGIYKNVVLLLC